MITRAVLCPCPPLLASELTGRGAVVPDLRAACADAVAWLVQDGPREVIVVGPAPATADWDPGARLDLSLFAPALKGGGKPDLPLSVGLGALLLDQAGYSGSRVLQAVGDSEPAAGCIRLGASLAAAAERSAPVGQATSGDRAAAGNPPTPANPAVMLVMGDGSARRTVSAPGHLDERAVPFDDEVERAVRAGDLAALASVDPGLAHELMATGRPAWQVLAGALGQGQPVTEVLYADAPFGVAYLVARFEATRQDNAGLTSEDPRSR